MVYLKLMAWTIPKPLTVGVVSFLTSYILYGYLIPISLYGRVPSFHKLRIYHIVWSVELPDWAPGQML